MGSRRPARIVDFRAAFPPETPSKTRDLGSRKRGAGNSENPEIRISGSRQDVIGGGLLGSGGAFSDVSDACFRGGFRRKRGPEIDRPRRPTGARI